MNRLKMQEEERLIKQGHRKRKKKTGGTFSLLKEAATFLLFSKQKGDHLRRKNEWICKESGFTM